MMDRDAAVYVAGSQTFIGAAFVRVLRDGGYTHVIEDDAGGDLCDAAYVERIVRVNSPKYVVYAGGASGGIGANRAVPATLMRDNLLSATHLIEAAHRGDVRKLLYLASSCCYPRVCPQPMAESALHTGALEPTNAPYASAKLAGITLCRAYRDEFGANFVSAIPANAYGPGEGDDAEQAHVIGALMTRMHEAKALRQPKVSVWGSGAPRRDFIFIDDLVEGAMRIMSDYDDADPINIASGRATTIRELAETLAEVVGFEGELDFDRSKPDGMPEKVLDPSRMEALAWSPQTSLREGLERTYRAYVSDRELTTQATGT